MQQETAAKPQVDTSVPSETTGRHLSLLQVAGIISEHGPQIAAKIYGAYKEKFETANPKQQTRIRKEDFPNQVICRQDWSFRTGKLDDKRQILVFIGPQTDIEELLSQYPRIRYIFKNNGQQWEYDHAKVGLAERELPTDVILTPPSGENKVRTEIVETKVEIDDFERVLAPFM